MTQTKKFNMRLKHHHREWLDIEMAKTSNAAAAIIGKLIQEQINREAQNEKR